MSDWVERYREATSCLLLFTKLYSPVHRSSLSSD